MSDIVKPIYGVNYGPGWDMFSKEPGDLVSGLISDIEKIGDLNLHPGWCPSHVWKIINETQGIEASTEGIAYFPLDKYFNDPGYQIVSCHPAGMTDRTLQQMLAIADKLVEKGLGYDYSGLIGDALEAFTFIDDLIPELRKVADPLHDSHDLFCSALVSTIDNGTKQYHNVPPFNQYTISKISPLILLKEFNYDKVFKVKDEVKQPGAVMSEGPAVSPEGA
jgi:hypothetical protein